MSSMTNSESTTSLQTTSNESKLEKKKINKIKKALLNIEKEEVTSFNPLKVKIYKEEMEEQNHQNEIKIPTTFKSYFEDLKKNKGLNHQVVSGLNSKSVPVQQVDSSDLVNSE